MRTAQAVQEMLPEAIVFDAGGRVYIVLPIQGRYDVPGDELLEMLSTGACAMIEGADISECDRYWHLEVPI